MRICGHCDGELEHLDGWEQSARERAGCAVEVDLFTCAGCGRRFRHRVDERFSGDRHTWWVLPAGGSEQEWELLPDERWPRLRAGS